MSIDNEQTQKDLYKRHQAQKVKENNNKQPVISHVHDKEKDEFEQDELTPYEQVSERKGRSAQRVTKKPFFQKGLFGFQIGKTPVEGLISPVLFLERDAGMTEVLEDIEPGIFPIKEKGKGIICSPLKLKKMVYNGEFIDYWYANENQAVAGFPEPIMDAEIVYQTTKKTVLNFEDFDKEAGSFKLEQIKLVGIIAGIAILAVYLIWSGMAERILAKFGLLDLAKTTIETGANAIGGGSGTEQVITEQVAQTTTPNTSTQTIPQGQTVTETISLLFAMSMRKIKSFFSLSTEGKL